VVVNSKPPFISIDGRDSLLIAAAAFFGKIFILQHDSRLMSGDREIRLMFNKLSNLMNRTDELKEELP